MGEGADILCFQCGQKFSDPPEVPLLESGEPCPSCTARLLEILPAPLPRRSPAARAQASAAEVVMELEAHDGNEVG